MMEDVKQLNQRNKIQMKTAKLCLHTGGQEVTLAQIAAVNTPAATETHYPIAHSDLIARVKGGLGNANLEIVAESHALAKDGNRYFGLFQIAPIGSDMERDYGLVMGLRNSHDKTFPAGITVGSQVFVCDNLAFSGEIRVARKHTLNIFRDLPGNVSRAIGMLSNRWNTQDERFKAYKGTNLESTKDVHDLLIRAMDNGAATVTQLKHVLAEWRTPTHEEFRPRNVWSLFNAFTEIGKGQGLDAHTDRTIRLHGLLDGFCGIVTNGETEV